jgi:hypothetical protein
MVKRKGSTPRSSLGAAIGSNTSARAQEQLIPIKGERASGA